MLLLLLLCPDNQLHHLLGPGNVQPAKQPRVQADDGAGAGVAGKQGIPGEPYTREAT